MHISDEILDELREMSHDDLLLVVYELVVRVADLEAKEKKRWLDEMIELNKKKN